MLVSNAQPLLRRVSITGADDGVDPEALALLAQRYPRVEWALLLLPEKEGDPRNPTRAWRERFLDRCDTGFTALHLCGKAVFDAILEDVRPWLSEWSRYGRIQININARRVLFTDEQVLRIFHTLHDEGLTLILQRHEQSAAVIDRFLNDLSSLVRVDVLFDASRGWGALPQAWSPTLHVQGFPLFCGHAGGLSPSTLPEALPRIAQAAGRVPYWIDMESGVRTANRFDLDKVQQILQTVNDADGAA